MRIALSPRLFPALGLGLALSYCGGTPLFAQGLPPSSGSGAGTGTGMSSGYPGSTGTGRESSSGLGTTGTGREGMSSMPLPRAFPSQGLSRPGDFRPGRDSQPGGRLSTVTPDLFLDARSINDPGERALALVRIAQTAIFSRQFNEAHDALFEAGPAALSERNPLIREQRMTAIINTLLNLAEERMSDNGEIDLVGLDAPIPQTPSANSPIVPPVPGAPPAGPANVAPTPSQTPDVAAIPPKPPVDPMVDRMNRLKAALPEWAQAVELARRIEDTTARTEGLYRIVESEAFSSQKIITDRRNPGDRPEPLKLDQRLRNFADDLLASAARHAAMIERPIWRDTASFMIISNAATSSQFKRGFEIARAIEQPEARTDALIRLAEGQAINGRPTEATAAYEEAARSVALIPQEDPRETLIGVLIDSLISYGRFDDARACVPLYAFPSRQLTALEAVAESQGKRNLAESARQWIAKENPAFQPLLYRKVNDGILASIERERGKDLMSGGGSLPPSK